MKINYLFYNSISNRRILQLARKLFTSIKRKIRIDFGRPSSRARAREVQYNLEQVADGDIKPGASNCIKIHLV